MSSDWPVRVRSCRSFEYNNHVNIYFGTGGAWHVLLTTPVYDVAIKDPLFLPNPHSHAGATPNHRILRTT